MADDNDFPQWAIEVDRRDGRVQYFAINMLEVIDDVVMFQTVEGESFELSRNDVKKVLVVKTSKKKPVSS